MTEQQTQHQIVIWFSQEWPEYYGYLFSVNNDTFNLKDAAKKKAMGLIKGVSDLILILPKNGLIAGIEIKAQGSKHKNEHIENQLNWGEKIESAGGYYIMSSDVDLIKDFIYSLIKSDFPNARKVAYNQIKNIKNQFVKKTILF